ncbi:phosphatidylserine decarboxylase [Geobacter pickeringii]|uniref:Phosphatidylserine decarboxylase n=1 Tax=Geobacter pickeringii TaxID=345632 RepID=A0A0B5B984_9BACT|nr:phosphatidylserine decarboxylase [Geobacter pickeringii]AJE03127.1 phosphatidylserine decarboxylase [Geobacter pickeringii]
MHLSLQHQYIDRESGEVRTEQLIGDRMVRLLYTGARENAPIFFRLATSSWSTALLGYLNFDFPLRSAGNFMAQCGIDPTECLVPPDRLDTPRKVFERQIRYWECRPLPEGPGTIVCPADARVLVGSFAETSSLFLKEKFFSFEELLGGRREWLRAFTGGDFAIFRLTPDKYHYNHLPVSGRVVDCYEVDGTYHSCNPTAVVTVATPYSKNKRVVTVIDTDVPRGSCVGLVAMVEVVALMIGEIAPCYSAHRYDAPQPPEPGMFVEKGQPKSLFRPGSSTDVLLFQKGRVRFADDLLRNLEHPTATSRFTRGFERPLVETDVTVRSLLAHAIAG